MNYKEIKEKLTELGVEFKGNAKKEDLEALLAESSVSKPKEMLDINPSESGTVTNEYRQKTEFLHTTSSRHDAVDVYLKNGEFVRTFSRELHGDGYVELSNKFVESQLHKKSLENLKRLREGRSLIV